jgi:hypothetical protein
MRRLGSDEWRRLVAEYETSGLLQKEFAAKHDVSLATFQFHLYKFRKLNTSRNSDSSTAFVPVELVDSPASKTRARRKPVAADGRIELELPGGLRVHLAGGTTARFLGEVLAVLK